MKQTPKKTSHSSDHQSAPLSQERSNTVTNQDSQEGTTCSSYIFRFFKFVADKLVEFDRASTENLGKGDKNLPPCI